ADLDAVDEAVVELPGIAERQVAEPVAVALRRAGGAQPEHVRVGYGIVDRPAADAFFREGSEETGMVVDAAEREGGRGHRGHVLARALELRVVDRTVGIRAETAAEVIGTLRLDAGVV